VLAMGLSIAVFIVWTVVGYAVLAVLYRRTNPLQTVLLAPAVGLAVTVLLLFGLSRLGLPVGSFGAGLAIGLIVLSGFGLWRSRPKLPWRDYLPFAAIFGIALLLTGRPMLEFGFDWLSYANDDMANYSLAAHRLLRHGFFEIPNVDRLSQGKDYTLFYWMMHVPGVNRTGSELILAWVCSWTGLNAHQIFMPTILAAHLVLISATGALVCQSKAVYQATLLTCALLSLSALNSYGALYQLIAQVNGLALLIGGLTLFAFVPKLTRAELIRQGIVTGVVLGGLLVTYPEVSPFLFLTVLLYLAVQAVRRQLPVGRSLLFVGVTALSTSLLLNTYFFKSFAFLKMQAAGGSQQNPDLQQSLFPFYLMPSGLADLWSLQGVTSFPRDPWLSASIALGALLLVTAIGISLFLSRWAVPIALITLVMLGVGFVLFSRQTDFGLFKLAMFVQPFLVGTMVLGWVSTIRQPWVKAIPLVLVGLISLSVQQLNYVETSRGVGNGVIEIPNASAARVNTEFASLLAKMPPSQNLLFDTANVVLGKFQSLYTIGREALFPSRDFYGNIAAFGPEGLRASPDPQLAQVAQPIFDRLAQTYQSAAFNLVDPQNPTAKNPFTLLKAVDPLLTDTSGNSVLVSTTSLQDIFNNRRFKEKTQANFVTRPLSEVNNLLIFNHSRLGQHYYLGQNKFISLYQLEKDYFLPTERMSGIGRYFLFEAIHPSPQVRLELNMTASLKGDKGNQLPPAEAIGTQRQSFGMVGRGSAHVFSQPLAPQVIEQRNFVGIDMGVEGKRFPSHKTGLMTLYGKDIPIDRRKLVGFGRDISLVSEAEYAALNPPSQLKTFPDDLAHPDLEYSGAYEDGWISEAAFFSLKQPHPDSPLQLAGLVPEIKDPAFSTALVISVEGKEIARQPLKPGEFRLSLPLPPSTEARRRIDLRFSQFQSLPDPDSRPIGAQLKFIGFAENG
jgi:hypothetical protein